MKKTVLLAIAAAALIPLAGCSSSTSGSPDSSLSTDYGTYVPVEGDTNTGTDLGTTVTEPNEPAAVDSTTAPAPAPVTSHKTTPKPKPKPTHEEPTYSPEVRNAIGEAQDYLSFQAFSRNGLIEQLSSAAGSGYPKAVAVQAVDSLHVDWNEQAYKSAQSYLKLMHFSRAGLIEQLESSAGAGFTHAQAVYGVNKAYK